MKMSNNYFLFFSNHSPQLSINGLANKMDVSHSVMMNLLRELEDKGYISRRVSMEDHRIKYIDITDKGLKLKKQMRELLL